VLLRSLVIILGLVGTSAAAYAQTDYSAGKTPAQLFSSDCSVCHKTPRGLAKTRDARSLTGFLREHYTSKVESAGALASYLLGNPGPAAETDARKRQGAEGAARPARAEPADETTIAAPEGGRRPQTRATRGKKPTAAELAREAKAAEEAAKEAAKARLQSYATTGEAARPLVTEPPVAPPAVATPPAEASPEPAVPAPATAESATPPAPTPNAEPGTAAPATPQPPPAAERPASSPPG
jgi:hypothetical protein